MLILPSVPPPRYSMPYKPDTDPSILEDSYPHSLQKNAVVFAFAILFYSLFFDPLTAEFLKKEAVSGLLMFRLFSQTESILTPLYGLYLYSRSSSNSTLTLSFPLMLVFMLPQPLRLHTPRSLCHPSSCTVIWASLAPSTENSTPSSDTRKCSATVPGTDSYTNRSLRSSFVIS